MISTNIRNHGSRKHRTAAKVAEHLRSFGLEVTTGVGGTGVVGLVRGASPGKTFAIRADMDALPIQKRPVLITASCNPGFMHACGHDAHMAMALGAAQVLGIILGITLPLAARSSLSFNQVRKVDTAPER